MNRASAPSGDGSPHGGRWFALALAALWIAAEVLPDARMAGAFDRTAIAQGEWWRLLTAHLVHLGAMHLALNCLGLWLIVELLWRRMSTASAAFALMCAAAAIDAGLWWWQAGIEWYVGASGLLHGLWAACVLERCARLPLRTRGNPQSAGVDWVGWIGGLSLLAKLAGEAWLGSSAATEYWTGAPVIDAAHRYGAAGGAFGWLAARTGMGVARRVRSSQCLHRRADFH